MVHYAPFSGGLAMQRRMSRVDGVPKMGVSRYRNVLVYPQVPRRPLSPRADRGMGVSGSRPHGAQAMNRTGEPFRRTSSKRGRDTRRGLVLLAFLATVNAVPQSIEAADMNKVVRHVFPAAEEGFDPQAAHDLYSGSIEQVIFETLLTYDYMARPSKLTPLTAEALPQISDDAMTYTFKLRKDIYFAPDPAFKGKARELVADDYVYSLKRLMDPKIHSPWSWLLEGKIVGLDEAAAKAKQTGKFDYDAKIE